MTSFVDHNATWYLFPGTFVTCFHIRTMHHHENECHLLTFSGVRIEDDILVSLLSTLF